MRESPSHPYGLSRRWRRGETRDDAGQAIPTIASMSASGPGDTQLYKPAKRRTDDAAKVSPCASDGRRASPRKTRTMKSNSDGGRDSAAIGPMTGQPRGVRRVLVGLLLAGVLA